MAALSIASGFVFMFLRQPVVVRSIPQLMNEDTKMIHQDPNIILDNYGGVQTQHSTKELSNDLALQPTEP